MSPQGRLAAHPPPVGACISALPLQLPLGPSDGILVSSAQRTVEEQEVSYRMALSARMLALIQKIEAADAAHFAMLHARAKKEAAARAKTLERKRANLRVARAVQAR